MLRVSKLSELFSGLFLEVDMVGILLRLLLIHLNILKYNKSMRRLNLSQHHEKWFLYVGMLRFYVSLGMIWGLIDCRGKKGKLGEINDRQSFVFFLRPSFDLVELCLRADAPY